jgi:hypothetical protein
MSSRVSEAVRCPARVLEKPKAAPITAKAQKTEPKTVEPMKNPGSGE